MEELRKLIMTLSEDNFKILISDYVKEKYKANSVRIIDGPYDGGNDIEIFVDDKEIKINTQVTIQDKGYEAKLLSDLNKASLNISRYAYVNTLEFYITKLVPKDKRNELIKNARINYNINLIIYDCNTLAQEAESYPSIRSNAYKFHNIKIKNTYRYDNNDKIIFDLLTLNTDSVAIKKNFLNAYIFSFFFNKPLSTIEDLTKYINPHFNNSLELSYIKKETHGLRQLGVLKSPNSNKDLFELSVEKYEELNKIQEHVFEKEINLFNLIQDFIEVNKIDSEPNEIYDLLLNIYHENFKIDVDEINQTSNSFTHSIRKTFNDIESFFVKKGIKKDESTIFTKKLIEICSKNDFLIKLSSTLMLNNLFCSDKLEAYINNKIPVVFLDTQILIRLVSVLYSDRINFKDMTLESSKLFLSFIYGFNDKIALRTSYDYIKEVTGHLLEAINLNRFLSLSFIDRLGKSNNVFFIAYNEYREMKIIDGETTFLEFLSDLFNIDIKRTLRNDLYKLCENTIINILSKLNIDIIDHPTYTSFHTVSKLYEMSMAKFIGNRSASTKSHDVRTIIHLSNKENFIDKTTSTFNEPFLITWDNTFYPFRKELIKSNSKEYSYWYIYSPSKFIDRMSVMNFNLNPSSINLNIISITENSFNISAKTPFIDVINSFFNNEDIERYKLIHKLSDLQKSTQELDYQNDNNDTNEVDEIDIISVLNYLRKKYSESTENYKFNDLIEVFENNDYEDKIIEIISNTIANRDFNRMVDNFNQLINENKFNKTK